MKVRKELLAKVANGEVLTDEERKEFQLATEPKKTFPQLYAEKFASLITIQEGTAKFPSEEDMMKAFAGTKYSSGEVAKSYKPAVLEYRAIIARIMELTAAAKKAGK